MTTTTLSLGTRLALATEAAKRLQRWIKKLERWNAAIDDYQAGYAEYPSLRLMPSKASKYRAYDDAAMIQRLVPEVTQDRASNVPQLKAVLASFVSVKMASR